MDATVSVHDKYQVELKVGYPLPADRGRTRYELDLYLFAPRSLGITPESYSKRRFYGDLKTYIRLKTPAVPLARFDDGESSPLQALRTVLELAAQPSAQDPPPEYENQVKLFCCILKSAVRDGAAYIQQTGHAEDRNRLVDRFVADVRRIAAGYRDLRAPIQTPGVAGRTLDLYLFGDEYISLLLEDYSYHLADTRAGGDAPLDAGRQQALLAVIADEVEYRRGRGYPSVPEERDDNETLVFRRSVLKKYVASILFLATQVKKEGLLLEQALFGLAAALAMVGATTIAFVSQSVYGTLSLPVFLALVAAYVFKDRIKDFLRYYLARKMTRFLFDHKARILDAERKVVGTCKESFEFVQGHNLPAQIRQLRDRDHITEIESGLTGEQSLLYRKRIRLYPRRVRRIFSSHKVDGVNDIMRLNVAEFLRGMDDPKKELFIMDDEGYHRIEGTRVYHLNMIMRFTHNGEQSVSRYRVVLNRKGIKRLEKVLAA